MSVRKTRKDSKTKDGGYVKEKRKLHHIWIWKKISEIVRKDLADYTQEWRNGEEGEQLRERLRISRYFSPLYKWWR